MAGLSLTPQAGGGAGGGPLLKSVLAAPGRPDGSGDRPGSYLRFPFAPRLSVRRAFRPFPGHLGARRDLNSRNGPKQAKTVLGRSRASAHWAQFPWAQSRLLSKIFLAPVEPLKGRAVRVSGCLGP